MLNDAIQTVEEDQTCPTVGYQSASICVPVTADPLPRRRHHHQVLRRSGGHSGPRHLRRAEKWNLFFHHQPGYLCRRSHRLRRQRHCGRDLCGLQRRFCHRRLHRLLHGRHGNRSPVEAPVVDAPVVDAPVVDAPTVTVP